MDAKVLSTTDPETLGLMYAHVIFQVALGDLRVQPRPQRFRQRLRHHLGPETSVRQRRGLLVLRCQALGLMCVDVISQVVLGDLRVPPRPQRFRQRLRHHLGPETSVCQSKRRAHRRIPGILEYLRPTSPTATTATWT